MSELPKNCAASLNNPLVRLSWQIQEMHHRRQQRAPYPPHRPVARKVDRLAQTRLPEQRPLLG